MGGDGDNGLIVRQQGLGDVNHLLFGERIVLMSIIYPAEHLYILLSFYAFPRLFGLILSVS